MRQTFEEWWDKYPAYKPDLQLYSARIAFNAAVSMMEAESKLQTAHAVNEAVLAHTVEARRLYVGTSGENFLNWLDKRIAASTRSRGRER